MTAAQELFSPARPEQRVQPPTYATPRTVINCYDFFDRVFPACGLDDFTDGIYGGQPGVSYEEAQRNQHDWLLDRAGCQPGSRLLDIGCGSGSLLATAKSRGISATGLNISPRQVERCRARGLDAHLLDYRYLDGAWWGRFDAVIANGSAEHFVQPADAAAGQADRIYSELFSACHRLLDPDSSSRRFVTTVIHFHRFVPAPAELIRNPFAFRWGSPLFHTAMLFRTMGGYYPVEGQLERCATPWFHLESETDGTEDYRRTSEEWLSRVRSGLFSLRPGLSIWRDLIPFVSRNPVQSLFSILLLRTQSWQWQFRPPNPPTRLLRHVWKLA